MKLREEKLQQVEEATQKILKAGADDGGASAVSALGVKNTALRKALVAQYDGGSTDESDGDTLNEDGTIKSGSRKKDRRARKQATAQELAFSHVNTNKSAPKAAAEAARVVAREESAQKKKGDKAATQADRDRKAQAKDARRARAVKGERRA